MRSSCGIKLTQVYVVSLEVMYLAFRKHRVVFQLGLLDGGGVLRDENQFRLARSQTLDRRTVAQSVLARLHDQLKLAVHIRSIFLLALSHGIGGGGGAAICGG